MKAVNLIPSEQRTGASVGVGRSHGAAYAVLAVILGLAVMVVLYGKANHAISSANAEVATLTAQAQRAEAQANQLSPYTSFVSMREQRMQAVETLLESRFDWAHVFHEFGRVMPAGTSISSLQGTVGTAETSSAKSRGAGVSSITPPGAVPTFTVAGCAVSQPAVAQLLERLRLIDGVSEVTLVTSQASSSGGGAASSGGCPPNDPSYTIQLTFDALPAASAVAAAVTPAKTTVSDKSGAAAGTPASTPATSSASTGVSAR
jgi:Tfp pilus assembly protein PilN